MRPDVRIAGARVQLRTIAPNNLAVLLDFRKKLAAGEGDRVCTGPNVAHPVATDGSDGAMADADKLGTSRGPDVAEPEGACLQRRRTTPDVSVGERQDAGRDALDAASRSPRVVDHITQTKKFRPLTPERRQQVIDLYRAGLPVKEIVRQTGINHSTVYRLRGQMGLERNHRFIDDDRAQAVLLRQQGLIIAEIATQLGFSCMIIGRYLAAACKDRRQLGCRVSASIAKEYPILLEPHPRHRPTQGCCAATSSDHDQVGTCIGVSERHQ